jgi:hypothetical protein
MEILGEINTDLLLRLRDLILGYIADEADKAWNACRGQLSGKDIKVNDMLPWDIKCKDIMLDEIELRHAAELLQVQAKVDNPYEELIVDAILWDCVIVEPGTYYLSSDTVRQYLGLNVGHQWNSASIKISDIMNGMIVLSKDEWKEQRDEWISVNNSVIKAHPDIASLQDLEKENQWLEAHPKLSQDIIWTKALIKRKGRPFRGYRIDLGKNDSEILDKFRAKIGIISKKSVSI